MHLDNLLIPRHLQSRDCVSCTAPTPQCNCASDETCYQTSTSCDACASVRCIANSTGSTGGSAGVSKGAVAGAVIAIIIVLGAVVGLYFWYKRRTAANGKFMVEPKPDIPAPADAVLNRPDPSEKLTTLQTTELLNNASTQRVYSTQSDGTIDLDPESQRSRSSRSPFRDSAQSNPFSDGNSIQTAGSSGSEGTNVIPIALVTAGPNSDATSSQYSTAPLRPARSPELNLNSDPLNVTRDGVRVPYAQSQISGISATSSRNSFISGMSYSSEMLNEAPVIVTNHTRQVIGSVKAEMVSASSSGMSSPTSSLGHSLKSRPSMRSPLASTSFGPSDVVVEKDEVPALPKRSPFDDTDSGMLSPTSTATFGQPTPGITVSSPIHALNQEAGDSFLPYNQPDRPSSVSSQAGSLIAGSIIDIGSATRVQVAQRSPYRTTMGRLVAATSSENLSTLEQQQQKALAHAQAQAHAQGGDRRRISSSSAISNTGDSILESFPFVPPSPISNRPIRSPPRSPNAVPTSQVYQHLPPPVEEPLPAPRDRRMLGMSTGSQLSTASSGLGSFPFQIEHPQAPNERPVQGRQRASLDTLALTSDLSTYPLGYDRS